MTDLVTIIGALAFIIWAGSFLALHLVPTPYEPVRDPVSNYAVSAFGWLYNLQAISSGIAAACLLGILVDREESLPTVGLVALGVYALSRLTIGFFPTDVEKPRTRTGTIHAILATTTFAGIAVAAGLLTPKLIDLSHYDSVGGALRIAAIVTYASAAAFAGVVAFRERVSIVGGVERGIYLGAIAWLGLNYWALLTNL